MGGGFGDCHLGLGGFCLCRYGLSFAFDCFGLDRLNFASLGLDLRRHLTRFRDLNLNRLGLCYLRYRLGLHANRVRYRPGLRRLRVDGFRRSFNRRLRLDRRGFDSPGDLDLGLNLNRFGLNLGLDRLNLGLDRLNLGLGLDRNRVRRLLGLRRHLRLGHDRVRLRYHLGDLVQGSRGLCGVLVGDRRRLLRGRVVSG